MDYGRHDAFLCQADVTSAQHNNLVANADVLAFSANLGSTMTTADRTALTAALTARGIPEFWVQNGLTWRQALRRIARICQVAQRFYGVTGFGFFNDGLLHTTPLSALTTAQRARLRAAIVSMGKDPDEYGPATLLREVMHDCAQRWGLGARLGAEAL